MEIDDKHLLFRGHSFHRFCVRREIVARGAILEDAGNHRSNEE